jgi:hypothetical protein
MPFNFTIPEDALESYHGRDIRIVYEVGISADMGRWKKDHHNTLSFKVLNSKMTYTFSGDRFFLGEEQKRKEGKPYLDLELEATTGTSDILKFSPGQTIRGRLKIDNADKKRITKAIIQLFGIEHPKWGRPRTASENIKKEIDYDESSMSNNIAFDVQIPDNARRS